MLAARYPQLAAEFLKPLLRVMQLARTYCGGDVDKFLVMMVIGLRTSQHPDFRTQSPERLMTGDFDVLPSLGVNGRSIAESLSIPKETVRRKIHELIGTGWVVRRDGRLHFTAKAYRDFAPIRREIGALAVRYYELVSEMREQAGR